jgi:hypothetical protein
MKKHSNIRKHLNFWAFLLGIILLCVLLNGCKSKQIVVGTTSQSHTNTTTVTTLKDTIVEVRFIAELPVFAIVPIRDTQASDTAFAENSTAKAMAFLQNGKLHLTLSAKDTTIPVHIPNAIRETTTNQTTDTKETTVVQQKDKKHFTGTLIERVLILLGLLLLIVLGILITNKRK